MGHVDSEHTSTVQPLPDDSSAGPDHADLRQQHEGLEAIFHALPDLYFRLTTDGTILDYRAGEQSDLYAEPENFLQRRLQDFLPDAIGVQFAEGIEDALAGQKHVSFEYPLVIGGEELHFEARLAGVSDGSVIAVVRNITVRKRAEEGLRTQKAASETVHDGIMIADARQPDHPVIYCNEGATRLTGYSSEELLGNNCRMLQGLGTDQQVRQQLREAVHAGRPFRGEILNYKKSGEPFWNLLTLQPLYNDHGELTHFVGHQMDITERKQTEERLRVSEERFRGAFEYGGIGIGLVSPQGRWLKVNPALCELLGYTEDELLQLDFQTITHVDDLNTDLEYVRQMLAGEINTYSMEKRYIHKQGHTVWIILSVSLVRDAHDHPLYFVSQIQDITKRKLAEQRLEQTNRDLLRSNAELDQLAAGQKDLVVQLEKSNDNLTSVLNELRLGVVISDGVGVVKFISRACEQLVGADQTLLGKHWTEVMRLSEAELARVQAQICRAPEEREKIAAQLETRVGRKSWLEIEIRQDPRDVNDIMFFLYDVTPLQDLRHLLSRKSLFHGMIGKSDVIQQVFEQIRALANLDSTVLIEGETGTGKEMVARAIHERGHRRNKAFVALNCAGLTESLLASQLFGHRRGSFTGAVADQEGVFETANGGTLFLDEIGDISPSVQASLLRVLQEREIIRIGETLPRKVDVRIIAATHRDLSEEIQEQRFRSDLLYRIRVARISLPPLRERRVDIPLLVKSFLDESRTSSGKSVMKLSDGALRALLDYVWPGNVRELRSAIEFGCIRCKGAQIGLEDLPPEIRTAERRLGLEQIEDERERLLAALERAKGNRSTAAKLLGMGRSTFYRRLREFHLDA